jgi:hypothetical protein
VAGFCQLVWFEILSSDDNRMSPVTACLGKLSVFTTLTYYRHSHEGGEPNFDPDRAPQVGFPLSRE